MEKRKKILYAITKSTWGGAQSYVYDLATAKENQGNEVAVLLGGNGELKTRLEDKKIRTIVVDSLSRDVSTFLDIKSFLSIIKVIKQEQPDILHLNSSKMGILGVLAGRLRGVSKIIFTAHGWAFNEDRPLWQRKIIKAIQKITVKLAHVTITVSEETKKQINSNKCLVIYNGVSDIDFYEQKIAREKITILINHKIEENKLWLGTISELHKNKGLEYLIKAIHLLRLESDKVPNVFIIGEGEERINLEKQIQSYHLQDKIFLLGRLDSASKYLKAFDLFSLTSITEALPYAILEAGQAGLPIIASKVGGIPEIIDHEESGILVEPRNVREIMQSLLMLVNDDAQRGQLGLKIKAKIEQSFNKEKMVKETLALYN